MCTQVQHVPISFGAEHGALALANCLFSHVNDVVEECYSDAFALQMLLHPLYVNPNMSERELNRLRDLLKGTETLLPR